jgi:hypothetical protein
MSRLLDIERLSITLQGVSANLAEAAACGLEDALQRRLGGLRLDRAVSVPELRIGPLDLPRRADAATLRELIAEHVFAAIDRMPERGPDEVS